MQSMLVTIVNWGSVADWVSGIGSLSAAIVALYIALFSQRVKLRGSCGRGLIITEGGGDRIDVLTISAINISPRPTTITNVVFTCGVWRRKHYYFVKFMRDTSTDIPTPLSDGQPAHWHIPMGPSNHWARQLVNDLKMTRRSVTTLRVRIYTSNGGTTVIRPDKDFRDTLMALVEENKIAKVLTK
jgi:hypothetical protein